MSFITSIGTAVPEHKFDQNTIAHFMEQAIPEESLRRKMQAVFRASSISTRHSVISDYGKEKDFSFYANTKNLEPFPSTEKRMLIYKQEACRLSLKAIQNCIDQDQVKQITHLITVSCTGMYAPGLDIDLVTALGLPTFTERICINFMGCYAAINALKVADSICKSIENAKVLIVCTELCSIHFQKEFSEDNILANALFADGSSAMMVEAKPTGKINYSLEAFHSDIIRSKDQQMAWNIGDFGFEMKLSSYIPLILEHNIFQLVRSLVSKSNIDFREIQNFAVHPGGKKILEAIAKELSLTSGQLNASYQVLKNYGNMSSPTIIFVLQEMLNHFNTRNNNEFVLGLAFGPGLTVESMILKLNIQ